MEKKKIKQLKNGIESYRENRRDLSVCVCDAECDEIYYFENEKQKKKGLVRTRGGFRLRRIMLSWPPKECSVLGHVCAPCAVPRSSRALDAAPAQHIQLRAGRLVSTNASRLLRLRLPSTGPTTRPPAATRPPDDYVSTYYARLFYFIFAHRYAGSTCTHADE